MRKLLLLLLLLAPCAHATIALVANSCASTNTTFGTSISCTLSSTPTSGNVLVLQYAAATTAGTTSAVTTNVSWTHSVSDATNTNRAAGVWCGTVSASAGTSVTLNLGYTATTGGQFMQVHEYSGLSCTVDTSATNSGSTADPTTGTITPTAGTNVLLVASVRLGAAPTGGTGTPTNGFTGFTPDASDARGEYSYLIVSSASGTYTTGWTAGAGTWASLIVAFQATGGVTPRSGFFLLAR